MSTPSDSEVIGNIAFLVVLTDISACKGLKVNRKGPRGPGVGGRPSL